MLLRIEWAKDSLSLADLSHLLQGQACLQKCTDFQLLPCQELILEFVGSWGPPCMRIPLDSLHLVLHGRALKGISANGFRVMTCLPEDCLRDSLASFNLVNG